MTKHTAYLIHHVREVRGFGESHRDDFLTAIRAPVHIFIHSFTDSYTHSGARGPAVYPLCEPWTPALNHI